VPASGNSGSTGGEASSDKQCLVTRLGAAGPVLAALRALRDRLLSAAAGRLVVEGYYALSAGC